MHEDNPTAATRYAINRITQLHSHLSQPEVITNTVEKEKIQNQIVKLQAQTQNEPSPTTTTTQHRGKIEEDEYGWSLYEGGHHYRLRKGDSRSVEFESLRYEDERKRLMMQDRFHACEPWRNFPDIDKLW